MEACGLSLSWKCLTDLYKVLPSCNHILCLVSSGLGKEMKDCEVIKNVSVVWLEKVQGLLCLDGQCCSCIWKEGCFVKAICYWCTALWFAVAVPRFHVVCKSSMLIWKSCVLVWKQVLALFIIWSPGRIKMLAVRCSLSVLWEKFSLICSYPSLEIVQIQVALASDQSTQNCFKYPTKLALNLLYYPIRMSSSQDYNVTSKTAL